MVNVIAQVPEPYAPKANRPPLSVGLFVDVEIQGATLPNLVVLPRSALRGNNEVLVVDAQSQLWVREVNVLRSANDEVYITGGLSAGEKVCISPLQSTVEGMVVRVLDETAGADVVAGDVTREPAS